MQKYMEKDNDSDSEWLKEIVLTSSFDFDE